MRFYSSYSYSLNDYELWAQHLRIYKYKIYKSTMNMNVGNIIIAAQLKKLNQSVSNFKQIYSVLNFEFKSIYYIFCLHSVWYVPELYYIYLYTPFISNWRYYSSSSICHEKKIITTRLVNSLAISYRLVN